MNFDSPEHAVRVGLLIGELRCAGLDASMTTDTKGDWTPVIRVLTQNGAESYEIEVLPQ